MKNGRLRGNTLIIRQIIGAIISLVIWLIDAEDILTKHPFPVVVYIVPTAIVLGWDLKKILSLLTIGTKYEKIFKEDIPISSYLIKKSVKYKVSPLYIRKALDEGLSEADISDLLDNNLSQFKEIYSRNDTQI